MNLEQFVRAVQRHAGTSDEIARRAAEKTLEVFGGLLTKADQKAVARELPSPLADSLRTRTPGDDYGLDEFYRQVDLEHDEASELPGFKVEHAQAVLAALADLVGAETRTRLQKHLPESFRELLEPREIPEYDGSKHRESESEERKLSSGRPGSSEPLAEAQREGHVDSVAESDNPYGDRKISTGTSSPNEGHDVATGNPDEE